MDQVKVPLSEWMLCKSQFPPANPSSLSFNFLEIRSAWFFPCPSLEMSFPYQLVFETNHSQITPLEYQSIFQESEADGLRRFFWIWTLKEAYTKALGVGLGFDF